MTKTTLEMRLVSVSSNPPKAKAMKVAVVGSRSFKHKERLYSILDREHLLGNISEIISGGAVGADNLAAQWACERGVPLRVYRPRWKRDDGSTDYAAGFVRNKIIAKQCDFAIAFWDGNSKGTKNTIDECRKLNKSIQIVRF